MGNSKAISVIALIFGIVGVGWLTYDQFFASAPLQTSTSRQYYDFHPNMLYPPGIDSWVSNPYLEINFTVNAGETVYFSYVATARIDDSSRPWAEIQFYFNVDGFRWSEPYAYFRRWNEDDPDGADIRTGSIALQHYNSSMSIGQHTISIDLYFYDSLDSVLQQTLFVQVFK